MSGGAPIVRKGRNILENDSKFSPPLPLAIGVRVFAVSFLRDLGP